MTAEQYRVAIVFPAGPRKQHATTLRESRLNGVAEALGDAGMEVVGAPYADELVDEVRAELATVDGVLVWLNPVEAGRDRTTLNALLLDIAAKGIFVSAHPEAIEKMGTKEVLSRTQSMSWGCDTRFYRDVETMRSELPASLSAGEARVLKQIRGHSGDGIWKVELATPPGPSPSLASPQTMLRLRHAKRGSVDEIMPLDDFLLLCGAYFASPGGMIDQPFQPRLPEGMIRCYVIGEKVVGFGEQLINALYPAQTGASPADAPQPGPRLYFAPTRPDFQRLKQKLESEWVPELCQLVGLERSKLPILWDADFLYGPKDAGGLDTYVLCEINVSSVYPFPPSALSPLVAETVARVKCSARL